jgi:hypothetical protein
MKKFVVLLMTIFLVFSINGFSQDKTHKKVQSAKIERSKKGNTKTGRKPKKVEPKKRIHKSGLKRHNQKKAGHGITL